MRLLRGSGASKLGVGVVLAGLALSLTACTNPYDPNQRALGGAALGAGSGAALGAIAGGGRGAAVGALLGGAVGAVGGAATTPPPPGYQPQPVYVQPAPVYYPPPPVYVEPAPVYVEPPVYYGRRGYYRRY